MSSSATNGKENGNGHAESDLDSEEARSEKKMANLLESVENSIWHAFDYLALEGDGTAPKSKLKVGIRNRLF